MHRSRDSIEASLLLRTEPIRVNEPHIFWGVVQHYAAALGRVVTELLIEMDRNTWSANKFETDAVQNAVAAN